MNRKREAERITIMKKPRKNRAFQELELRHQGLTIKAQNLINQLKWALGDPLLYMEWRIKEKIIELPRNIEQFIEPKPKVKKSQKKPRKSRRGS